jgi:hypothetical protein
MILEGILKFKRFTGFSGRFFTPAPEERFRPR